MRNISKSIRQNMTAPPPVVVEKIEGKPSIPSAATNSTPEVPTKKELKVPKEALSPPKPPVVEKHQAFKTQPTTTDEESDPFFKGKVAAKKSIAEAVQSLKK